MTGRGILASVLVLCAGSVLWANHDTECVGDGECIEIEFERPDINDPSSGIPPRSKWGSETPQAMERDPGAPDDSMGNASPDGDKAKVKITNEGGDLSGPNGQDQNGGAEGDCIEVYVCWVYYTEVDVSATTRGFWGSVTHTWKENRKRYWCSDWIRVCPC